MSEAEVAVDGKRRLAHKDPGNDGPNDRGHQRSEDDQRTDDAGTDDAPAECFGDIQAEWAEGRSAL